MDRFDVRVRLGRQETVDHVRAGTGFGLRAATERSSGKDAQTAWSPSPFRTGPSPCPHTVAKVPAEPPVRRRADANVIAGFSRSLRTRTAGAVEKSRRARLDKSRNHLSGIVPVARRLSRLDARNARMLRCHARRNEAGRHPDSGTAQWGRHDRWLSVAAPPMKPIELLASADPA
jgi:hypothetical protein